MKSSTRIVLFSIAFSVLVFAAICWSTAPRTPDSPLYSDQYSKEFKVGMNQEQAQAVLDRYGPPYLVQVVRPEYRVVEGETKFGTRYGTCSLVFDRNGTVSSVVRCDKEDAFAPMVIE